MTKTSNIIMALAAIALMGGCTQEDDQQNAGLTEIRLTTSINQTRVTTTQDVQIANDEQVYVWAFKQAASGAAEFATPYIKAWQLKADGAGGLSSVNTTHYYYPTEKLTFVGIHGNFSETLTESSTAMPTTVTHTVESNQNSAANYAKSDLLRWEAYDKATSSSAITAQFSHQLTKIVVVLNSSEYSASELNAATITINGIKRQITLNPQTAALGSASGSATAITPYHTANIHHEAIVPPQDKPDGLITITMNGWSTTLTPSQPASAFAANTKYTYTLDVKKQQVTMTESITQWNDYTAGGSDPVTITDEQGIAPRNVKMNPLWYVAETNVDYTASDGTKTWDSGAGKFTFASSITGGYYFSWADALRYFTTSDNVSAATPVSINGYYSGNNIYMRGWHLPCSSEWNSIFPSCSSDNSRYSLPQLVPENETGLLYSYNTPICFGFNDRTKGISGDYMLESSYWFRKNSSLFYAIRYCGTEFCSAWKYEWAQNTLTISCTLLPVSLTAEEAETAYGTTESNWTAITFGNDESIGAVQRSFYCTGHVSTAYSGNSANYIGQRGNYWTSTADPQNSSYVRYFHFYNTSTLTIANSGETNGDMVRLFRDNPDKDVLKNPLWYVAEYNMTNATTMASTDNAGYFFNWSDAMTNFGASTSSYNGYKKGNKTITGKTGTWHLPTKSEWLSVIPGELQSLWAGTFDELNNSYRTGTIVNFGCNYETKTVGVSDKSFWHKVSDTELHAIRFIGTPYCSAWKYITMGGWTDSNYGYLVVSATMIEPVADDGTGLAAKLWYNRNWNSITFGNNVEKGAVQRTFYARGYHSSASGAAANSDQGIHGYYWTSKEDTSPKVWRTLIGNGHAIVGITNYNTFAFSVRLFLDN